MHKSAPNPLSNFSRAYCGHTSGINFSAPQEKFPIHDSVCGCAWAEVFDDDGKIVSMLRPRSNRRIFAMRLFWSKALLRYVEFTLRITALIGVFLLTGGIASLSSSFSLFDAAIFFSTGIVCIWAWICGLGYVEVTDKWVKSQNFRPRRVRRTDVSRIDVVPWHSRGRTFALPRVFLKDGKSFGLLPLAFAKPMNLRSTSQITLANQQLLVDELRTVLGVSGADFSGNF